MEYLINFAVTGFDCGGADVLRILKFVFILLDLVLFVVPIGLIVIVMVDFAKNVIAGRDDDMKKNLSIAIKRIIYCVVLFLVPTIVDFAIKLVGEMGVTAAETASACIEIAKTHDLSQYEMNYEEMEPKRGAGEACEKDEQCLSGVCTEYDTCSGVNHSDERTDGNLNPYDDVTVTPE